MRRSLFRPDRKENWCHRKIHLILTHTPFGPALPRRAVSMRCMIFTPPPAGESCCRPVFGKECREFADFGCGVGVMTRMLAEIVGPSGSVTGIDISGEQIEQASEFCERERLRNTYFVKANASHTGLPRNLFDLVYCRFLLLHLSDPAACLREMRDVLRPGGILVVEDGDLASATSVPPTPLDAFADLFCRYGPTRGLDYSLAKNLYHLVVGAGFSDANIEIHQPAIISGENRILPQVERGGGRTRLFEAGIVSATQLQRTLAGMQEAIENPKVLILAPRMSLGLGAKSRRLDPPSTEPEQDDAVADSGFVGRSRDLEGAVRPSVAITGFDAFQP